MEKRHFQTFDALRFFAFLKVFLFHLPIISFPFFSFVKKGGGIGVIFFFVLSGFLITYIILEEKQQTGRLNLYHFFIRRILRIWPLYYLMIAFAFITPFILTSFDISHSNEGYKPDWLMSLAFLENYKMIVSNDHPNVSPLNVMWSLCIEEHFYIVWGISFYFIRINKVPILIVASIAIANISRYYFSINGLETLDLFTNIDYFAYGAIPAYLLISKESIFNKMGSVPLIFKILALTSIIIYVLLSPHMYYSGKELIEPTVWGVLFTVLIIIVIPSQSRFSISDKNILSKCGVFTYGLYLYHTIVINLFKQVFNNLDISLDVSINAVSFFVITFTLTLSISFLSYHLFEKRFLKLKRYFY